MKFPLLSCLLFIFLSSSSNAQTAFPTINYIDINNINAGILVHGDMWRSATGGMNECEFPKGSTRNIASSGALWMSGYDADNNLHLSAQTYRQTGNDFWPGPLDTFGHIDYTTSQNWAKIWKVNKSDIDAFLTTISHTTANTPSDILTWPAKGNVNAAGSTGPLTITKEMAPFIDVNHDGIYNAMDGDYPAIHGDQALWWIYNDNGPTHDQTNGLPNQVEIHCMAYGYSRGTLIDNVIYYDYTIKNLSPLSYSDFRVGQFADFDLGWAYDDYVGFDSTHRLGYQYNGADSDLHYGRSSAIVGVTIIVSPSDNSSYVAPAGSFMYYNGDPSMLGNPSTDTEYNNYLRSKWRDGSHLIDDFAGYGQQTTGHNTSSTNYVNYVYPGKPGDTTQWSECTSENAFNDRRFVLSSGDFSFAAGETKHIVMALVATNLDTDHVCSNFNYTDIETVADTAWAVYTSQPATDVSVVQKRRTMNIYPNPAHNIVNIEVHSAKSNTPDLSVYNILGQRINVPISTKPHLFTLDLTQVIPGVYTIRCKDENGQETASFVKR